MADRGSVPDWGSLKRSSHVEPPGATGGNSPRTRLWRSRPAMDRRWLSSRRALGGGLRRSIQPRRSIAHDRRYGGARWLRFSLAEGRSYGPTPNPANITTAAADPSLAR